MSTEITVAKIEVARRQLRTAIELWFYDGDPVSIHSLAAASHQIVHDLNRKNGGPNLMLDAAFIKAEYRKEFLNNIKHASNFMKHADRPNDSPRLTLLFRPETNRDFMLFTIICLGYLDEELGTTEIAFERWHTFNNPNLMSDTGIALFENTFTTEQRAMFTRMKKHKFFESFHLNAGKSAGVAEVIHRSSNTSLDEDGFAAVQLGR